LNAEQLKSKARFYRSKTKDSLLYEALQRVVGRFVTLDRLRDIAHQMDTQMNESFNNTASWFAPKNKVYCGSLSLTNRLSMAVGINSLGLSVYFGRLWMLVGITMVPGIEHFLNVKDATRQKRHDKRKLQETKKLRSQKVYDLQAADEKAAKMERLKRTARTYVSGQNMDPGGLDGYTADELLAAAAKKPKKVGAQQSSNVCPLCGKTGHKTNKSMHCQFYEGTRKPTGKTNKKTAAVLIPTTGANADEQQEQQPGGPETDLNAVEDRQSAVELDAMYSQLFHDDDSGIEGFIDADTWSSDEEEDNII
jgi:hypothetical protein